MSPCSTCNPSTPPAAAADCGCWVCTTRWVRILPTTYLGTYDWPGPGYRDHQLTATLREIDVPLSDRHFAAADRWRQLAGGKTVIDASFPLLAHDSPEFVKAARAAVCDAEIVVFSHPWVYPLIGDALGRREQLVVYDAHNVESVLRYRLLADSEIGLRIVRNGTAVERDLCRRADLVLTCSHEDRDLFHRLYEIPFGKCLVVPNGTFVGEPPDAVGAPRQEAPVGAGRQTARDVPRQPVSTERGSGGLHLYGTGAGLPDVNFAICGGVGSAIDQASLARRGIANVRITGVVDDTARRDYLAAADVAVNPMFSGSGTNIKMFDFMAAGLPVISTPTGARGINLVRVRAACLHGARIRRMRCDTCSPMWTMPAVSARLLAGWRARAMPGSASPRAWGGC